jgi:hypothetical protein
MDFKEIGYGSKSNDFFCMSSLSAVNRADRPILFRSLVLML